MNNVLELQLHDSKLIARQAIDVRNRLLKKLNEDSDRLSKQILLSNQYKLDYITNTIHLINPENVMNKGYSLTMKNGKPLKDAAFLEVGDDIETMLKKGKIKSRVTKVD